MRIRKQYQVIPTNAKLENGDSTSTTNGYVAEYINDHSVVVSAVEPSTDRKKVWLKHGTNIEDKTYILNDNNIYEEYDDNKPVVLYENSSGEESVVLSDSVSNYEYIEIYGKDSLTPVYWSIKLNNPNNKNFYANYATIGSNVAYFFSTLFLVSGNKITPDSTSFGYVNMITNSLSHTNRVRIVKVIGYK